MPRCERELETDNGEPGISMNTMRLKPNPQPPSAAGMDPSQFRDICAELAQLRYRGIAIGHTLNDCLLVHLYWGHGDWRSSTRWLHQAGMARHALHPRHGDGGAAARVRGRTLLTWQQSTPRLNQLLLPVLEEIGAELAAVVMGTPGAVPGLTASVPVVASEQAADYSPRTWRAEYGRCRAEWDSRVRDVCRTYDLPRGAFEVVSLNLMVSSQRIEGFLRFLEESAPPVVLTEYDRNHLWSCLILAADRLGIPTVTLVHGVVGPEAIGFSPALAGRVVCWGDADRQKFLAAGEPAGKVVVGGCPRITRELALAAADAKARLGIEAGLPLALLATSPDRGYLQLAEAFCRGVEAMPEITGVVRLHPAESMAAYAEVAARHRGVKFMRNREATLEESLAAADVIVVRGSGMGGDALVKRRPVVVLDPLRAPGLEPIGHDWDLIHKAGCPSAHTSEELTVALRRLIGDETFRREKAEEAERYVVDFCGAFGRDSARLIAGRVREAAGQR
jgi:hypothetical protein